MTSFTRALPLLLGLGMVAGAASAGMANADTPTPRCTIVEHTQNGMRSIEGSVLSPRAITGEYRLAIKTRTNGNSSSVSQGGVFAAPADEPVSVGQVMINADTRNSVDFSITVGGQTIACAPPGARFT